LKFLAQTVPEIRRESQNFKRSSPDPFTICQLGVGGDPIFVILDPDIPIHYTTFMGLRWWLRVVYPRASPLLRPFWREISVPSKVGQKLRFGRKMGSKCKILFLGPLKGTSLRETTSFDVLIVKIGAGILAVGWQKKQKTPSHSRRIFVYLGGDRR